MSYVDLLFDYEVVVLVCVCGECYVLCVLYECEGCWLFGVVLWIVCD